MKKVFAGAIAALGIALMAGCSAISDAVAGFEYGSLVVSTGSGSRYLDGSEISMADVNVYSNGTVVASKTGILLSNGNGSATVDHIPVGKNRVVEVIGYKAENVEGQRLYCVTDIYAGDNEGVLICDGEASAKGKAYLALGKAGVDVTGLSISGFVTGKSSCYFDAEAFTSAYNSSSSVNPADYYTAAGVVTLSNIKNADGYTVWVGDPISSKLSISSNSTSKAEISDVAPGTWNVYVNDGNSVTVAGTVTVTNKAGTFAGLIGKEVNPFDDKVLIFVKPGSYNNIYVWTTDPIKNLTGQWPGLALDASNEAASEYMNNPDGWYMVDITQAYADSGKEIWIILNDGNSQTGNIPTGKKGTFWYDAETGIFYDADPTTPVLPSNDTSVSSIKINGIEVSSTLACEVANAVTAANIEVKTTDSKATYTVSSTGLTVGANTITVTVTAEDGTTQDYTITVTRKEPVVDDVSLESVTIGGKSVSMTGTNGTLTVKGADESFSGSVVVKTVDNNAQVVCTPAIVTVADGASETVSIKVTNGAKSETYTVTVDYSQNASASDYYWTNKNGYGSNKKISSWSDWTEDMKIAQGAANDDPRVYCAWSMHENPYDVYAMYAAYDSENLYIMLELPNVQDIVAPGENYPLSDNGQYWNRGTPFFFAFDTGKGAAGNGLMADGTYVWGNNVQYSESNVNRMIVCHSLPSKGTPGVFIPDSNGMFSYKASNCLTWKETGVSVTWDGGANKTQGLISKNLYGIKAVGQGQGRDIANIATDTYVDFYSPEIGHNPDYDLKWQITIPLSALDVDEAYVKSHGIGVMFVNSDGGSGMDCLPWDPSMADNAAKPYSKDESSSAEKEDLDVITTPFARIGK